MRQTITSIVVAISMFGIGSVVTYTLTKGPSEDCVRAIEEGAKSFDYLGTFADITIPVVEGYETVYIEGFMGVEPTASNEILDQYTADLEDLNELLSRNEMVKYAKKCGVDIDTSAVEGDYVSAKGGI